MIGGWVEKAAAGMRGNISHSTHHHVNIKRNKSTSYVGRLVGLEQVRQLGENAFNSPAQARRNF